LLFGVFFIRFFYLQIYSQEKYSKRSQDNRIRQTVIQPPRGLIYDRNGVLLVDNQPSYFISFIPYEVKDKEFLLDFFNNVLNFNKNYVVKKIHNSRGYKPVRLMQVDFLGLSIVEENKLDLPGVIYQIEPIRHYPSNVRASHLLGYTKEIDERELSLLKNENYVSGDVIGKQGLEKEYEKSLRGEKGYEYFEVDVQGKVIRNLGKDWNIPPKQGKDLHLSIDSRLQKVSEDLMEGKRGAVVALDPRNGEVLALVSKPDYDPGKITIHLSEKEWKSMVENPDHPLFNRATKSLYPPGSTIKLIAAFAALNENIITPEWSVECNGSFKFGIRRFNCWKPEGHGKLDLLNAIEQSCNVYFYKLSLEIGIDIWSDYASRFGFGKKTGIDLPEESAGLIPTRELYDKKYGKNRWTDGNMLNVVIGQGEMQSTPLQMAVFAMIIANNGKYYQPHIVRYIEDRNTGKRIQPRIKFKTVDGIREDVYKIIKEGMYRVVNGVHGTGRLAAVREVKIAGKTGTAQNPHGNDHAWFIGFAPLNNPGIAISVIVENGGAGGGAAAPLAGKIFKEYFRNVYFAKLKN
ncbi:penicillin-binding protein 2, partial [candidate division KSB1 bacterium]